MPGRGAAVNNRVGDILLLVVLSPVILAIIVIEGLCLWLGLI